MKKKILIILGNTKTKSFCKALVNTYQKEAQKSGYQVERINLQDLKFDPILHEGFDSPQPLESDLVKSQKLIRWADHIVFVYPIWWMAFPAILKGFIDRVFTSGFAFRYHKGKMMPEQLLRGKSARLIVTMDSPPLIYRFWFGAPGNKMMKRGILGFCGVSPIRITNIGSVKRSTDEKRKKWLGLVKELGRKGE